MGKLCIVSDAEGLAENVLDGLTGFVVPKRNPVSLADKIVEVFQLSEIKKEEIGNQAINRVREAFTIEKQLQEFIQFYD
ncbi:Glycosyl transferases group 1 [compost metagenome]